MAEISGLGFETHHFKLRQTVYEVVVASLQSRPSGSPCSPRPRLAPLCRTQDCLEYGWQIEDLATRNISTEKHLCSYYIVLKKEPKPE